MLSPYCFFFNDTATTEIYTLSLHDALPISSQMFWWAATVSTHDFRRGKGVLVVAPRCHCTYSWLMLPGCCLDRKSTRLNSSHANISYAVFCLKKKKNMHPTLSILCLCDQSY